MAARVSARCPSPLGLGELKEVPSGAKLVGRPVPLAPTFQPTDAMIQGAVWPRWDPPPPCCRAQGGGAMLGSLPVPPVLEGTAWLPALHLIPVGVPVLEEGVGVPAMPCATCQACGTRSGWAGPRCCPTAP